jgi:hypothetical protein
MNIVVGLVRVVQSGVVAARGAVQPARPPQTQGQRAPLQLATLRRHVAVQDWQRNEPAKQMPSVVIEIRPLRFIVINTKMRRKKYINFT